MVRRVEAKEVEDDLDALTGETVTTRPGTFTAFSQPYPRPHAHDTATKAPIAARQEAATRATVAARWPRAHRSSGRATSGRA